ncbi:DUF4123 domain-containing protein [Entomomonas asaccharolytica]|uniref:DUF4123 domain-containing protein n=1 Tax=Entomomonas asaccharolytica TaxID=2785331 RepID=A0A974NGF0_9GAMM|nr:DUF4123 domain-containing protein [Entomomonas asaccharolytica]QQP86037.1 DUF4123 domain-containing protein [Entomomonas asaccharolytica]
MTEKLYAIIDGAAEDELLPMLKAFDPPVSCLYAEPVQDELVAIAPYLVQVTDEVKQWLTTRDSFWGFYCTSAASLKELRHHLRKHLQAMIEGEEKAVFFRFYDPRNIWVLCDLLTDWQLYHFLGPIKSITTDMDGITVTKDFKERREQFPHDAISRKKMLTFTLGQMAIFERHLSESYIQKLAAVLKRWHHKETVDYPQFAHDIFNYLQSLDITDDRIIRGIGKLCLTNHYYCFDDIPNGIKSRLEAKELSALMNAELLLVEQFGSVPLLDK